MTPLLPRIAIPQPTSNDEAYNLRSLPQYIRAIEAAGGFPVVLSLSDPLVFLISQAASCSGVVLPGSPADVDPKRYGQQAVPECAAPDAARERVDDLLLNDAAASGKPVFGICFGLQSLNVWRQGSLIQDLPKFRLAAVNHEPGREVEEAHAVQVTPGSRMAQVLEKKPGVELLQVNSSHHQAIGEIGDHLSIAARSPMDGVIEAIEGTNLDQFMLGVQWHPERSYETSGASRALFAAFVDAARSRADRPL